MIFIVASKEFQVSDFIRNTHRERIPYKYVYDWRIMQGHHGPQHEIWFVANYYRRADYREIQEISLIREFTIRYFNKRDEEVTK